MDANRKTTVMFTGFIDMPKLLEAAGDSAAQEALMRCFDRIGVAAKSCGGRLVKTMQDKAMVLIATPDAAADAAVAIHTAVNEFPAVAAVKLELGIAFHYGPVIQKATDVFGDTVNLAARLGEQAAKAQIITSQETAGLFSPIYHPWVRALGTVQVKGRSDEVGICELVWRADDSATLVGKRKVDLEGVKKLKLKHGGSEVERRRERDAIVIGREEDCGLVVDNEQASRHHCTIERRGDKFVIADTSSNGTYVTIQGEEEVLLRREELVLRKRGWLAFGEPRAVAKEAAVEFICY